MFSSHWNPSSLALMVHPVATLAAQDKEYRPDYFYSTITASVHMGGLAHPFCQKPEGVMNDFFGSGWRGSKWCIPFGNLQGYQKYSLY